jgi:drug/metabolite transporter (DMT)-like permease
MFPAPGELAALATALCWTASSAFFTISSRRIGSVTVNRMRLLVAAGLLAVLHWAIEGSLLPLGAEPERWMWLSLSGVVGLTLGDAFLFQAYVWIGARLTMLMMSTVPVISTFLAWIFVGERLTPQQWLGVALTLAGITWVVLDRNHGNPATRQDYRRGILFGLGAAAGQAIGLILAKKGLGGDFPALSGNLIRMVAAVTSMWAFTLARGQAGPTLRRVRQQPRALLPILGGSISGPVVGVWFSLLSIQLTHIGVASTIMALPPVFLLPVARIVFGERIGGRAVVGTLVAMAGVALLFLA